MAEEYDILSDVEKMLRPQKVRKPRWLSREHWNELSEETRYLWNRVQQLDKMVYEAYLEALRHEDWRRALELVLLGITKPILPDAKFRAKAKKWIAEVEGLLESA